MAIEHSLLVVRSITNAMRGQKILEQNGFSVSVQRNATPSSTQGCGYALKVAGDRALATGLLNGAGIKVVEIQEV